jgi:hypothetical protein
MVPAACACVHGVQLTSHIETASGEDAMKRTKENSKQTYLVSSPFFPKNGCLLDLAGGDDERVWRCPSQG